MRGYVNLLFKLILIVLTGVLSIWVGGEYSNSVREAATRAAPVRQAETVSDEAAGPVKPEIGRETGRVMEKILDKEMSPEDIRAGT